MFQSEAGPALRIVLCDANEDLLTLIAKRDVVSEDHRQEWQEWRAQWDRSFLDMVTAVDFLLETTSEDDMIRAIVTKWLGDAVDLMARQAKDD